MSDIKNLWTIIDGAAKEAGRDASQLTKNRRALLLIF
jgi:hypothetical protein